MAGAIVHEWVARTGGSERVFEAMARVFPDADLFTLWDDSGGENFNRAIHESWLSRTPLRRHKALALPLMPTVWRTLRARRGYEWVLVSSHVFAHHARFAGQDRNLPKLIYAHTPARYIWEPGLDSRGRSSVVRLGASILRPLDRRRNREAVAVATNSEFVRKRVQDAWDRDATVIHPPVEVALIRSRNCWQEVLTGEEARIADRIPDVFVLGASRFVPYKRLEVVLATGAAAGVPVVIAGDGPERARLRALAADVNVPVHIVRNPSDALLYALYQRALAYVFPAVEDFGIMPVEAMAAGCPVVVGSRGGASESVRAGVSGAIAESSDVKDLVVALEHAAGLERRFIPETVQRFSVDRFQHEIRDWVELNVADTHHRDRPELPTP